MYCIDRALFKNEKENLLKKDVSHLKIARHSNIQKKNIEEWERKTKTFKDSKNNNIVLLLLFYIEKFIFC